MLMSDMAETLMPLFKSIELLFEVKLVLNSDICSHKTASQNKLHFQF
jgi:hypothetical protein